MVMMMILLVKSIQQKKLLLVYLFACPLRICLWIQSSSLSTAANTIEVNVSKRLWDPKRLEVEEEEGEEEEEEKKDRDEEEERKVDKESVSKA